MANHGFVSQFSLCSYNHSNSDMYVSVLCCSNCELISWSCQCHIQLNIFISPPYQCHNILISSGHTVGISASYPWQLLIFFSYPCQFIFILFSFHGFIRVTRHLTDSHFLRHQKNQIPDRLRERPGHLPDRVWTLPRQVFAASEAVLDT